MNTAHQRGTRTRIHLQRPITTRYMAILGHASHERNHERVSKQRNQKKNKTKNTRRAWCTPCASQRRAILAGGSLVERAALCQPAPCNTGRRFLGRKSCLGRGGEHTFKVVIVIWCLDVVTGDCSITDLKPHPDTCTCTCTCTCTRRSA